MGEKLVKYYEMAAEHGALKSKSRLAMKTTVSSAKAASEPDSPEMLEKFHAALVEIMGTDVPKL